MKTAIALLALALCGCSNLQVPRTHISGSIGGEPFDLSSPKDTELQGLNITRATNGTVSITISNLSAKMNPAIVQMSGDAFVNGINAMGTQIINGLAAGAKAAAK